MKLLLVEDDQKIATFIVKGLRQEGHTVDWATDAEQGRTLAELNDYDAAVVDVLLPGSSGVELTLYLRAHKNNIPILILSARSSVDDRIRGLQAGADDYLTKPFAFAELVARLQALFRRASHSSQGPTTLTHADLTMDLLTRRVSRGGKELPLQAKEFTLLEYFLRNPERVLTKTLIMQQVWGYSFDPQTNVVDVLVCRLRNKVDRDFPKKLIHTLRGVGYVLRAE
jgi:DNA-binding response OmpR family regulator